MHKPEPTDLTTAQRLRSIIERVERLESQKADIATDITEVYAEAKSTGFDTKTIRKIVAERKKTVQQRAEEEALLDLYKAALGMLDGTPLGSAAIDRLTKKKPPKPDEPPYNPSEDEAPPPPPESPKPPTDEEIVDAKAAGWTAAQNGESVLTNPYPARDPRRASWDEGWCAAAGTDGMDIPDAWRPTKKEPKKKEDGTDE